MKISIKILAIFFLLLAGCSKDSNETPYFEDFNIHFDILVPPFYTGNMNIKSDNSFKITYISQGDSLYGFKAVNDSVIGSITDLEMTKLIELCKLADVYKVDFSNTGGGTTCYSQDSFLCEIEINGTSVRTNKLSFSEGNIPKESSDLQDYTLTLMNRYYKWR